MSELRALIAHNRANLAELLAMCEDDGIPLAFFQATAGPHLRHVLDHYDRLLQGLAAGDGAVNYDQRSRDTRTELDRHWCTQRIRRLILALEQLSENQEDVPLQIVSRTSADRLASSTGSSLARELQFLQSHTVHHQALIRLAAAHCGLDLDRDFGKAASTIAHEQAVVGE